MSQNGEHKVYEPSKIPSRSAGQSAQRMAQKPESSSTSGPQDSGVYYEIEYDASPFPGVGKFVPKPQKIAEASEDPIREKFVEMRDISRVHRSPNSYVRFFGRNSSRDNSFIFYKQALLMADFTDDFEGNAPFSEYFPYYQMMGYDQLRTYFTWRTSVRGGTVANVSLSYAFLYIYELLSNIGVRDPQEGLEKLLFFWQEFRVHNKAIEKYVLRWVKDYHVYYELPWTFHEFAEKHNLTGTYPKLTDSKDSFELYCTISRYDIRKSAYYASGDKAFIKSCFNHVIQKLKEKCDGAGIDFEHLLFEPARKNTWTPFRDALFYAHVKQRDRQVVLSEHEIYLCNGGKWAFSETITTQSGKQLAGYIFKLMESVLRHIAKHKNKLNPAIDYSKNPIAFKLREAGISLENVIRSATQEYYREANKTVVNVDLGALSNIRREALATQEKLIVEETEPASEKNLPLLPPKGGFDAANPKQALTTPSTESSEPKTISQNPIISASDKQLQSQNLDENSAFTETEIKALTAALSGEHNINDIAAEGGIMPEVLIDYINEKAMELIGDNIFDEEFVLYDDYIEIVKEWIQ
ncbi:MAG: TerB N-terminal domain-containing protein [Oscillospiraceae bacterium]|nr:TerB N-terminal domain-containing protein [Oscillospiraceae bacterium]